MKRRLFIMLSFNELMKQRSEKDVCRELNRAIKFASTNKLYKYPFNGYVQIDTPKNIPLSMVNDVVIETANEYDLEYVVSPAQITLRYSNAHIEQLQKEAEKIRDEMILKVERDQELFIESTTAKYFDTPLHRDIEYLELAKAIFEPKGFVVVVDKGHHLWVKDPALANDKEEEFC
jgi:hypothetical protein